MGTVTIIITIIIVHTLSFGFNCFIYEFIPLLFI